MSPTHLPEISRADFQDLKAFACTLADAAAAVSLRYFRNPVSVDNKEAGAGGFDPVTIADQGAEKAIRALIEDRYPDHSIHGEEFGHKRTDSPFEWVLDPIDGTRAFISGLPTWGTLIALTYQGVPVIGVIDQPYMKERYLGWTRPIGPGQEMRGGATLNGEPMTTRACAKLSAATLSTTDANLFHGKERKGFDTLLGAVQLARYGLDCYAYGIVASGHMDLVVESGLQPYDMMALIPVIRGAGGAVSDWRGHAPGDSGHILAVGDAALLPQAEALLVR